MEQDNSGWKICLTWLLGEEYLTPSYAMDPERPVRGTLTCSFQSQGGFLWFRWPFGSSVPTVIAPWQNCYNCSYLCEEMKGQFLTSATSYRSHQLYLPVNVILTQLWKYQNDGSLRPGPHCSLVPVILIRPCRFHEYPDIWLDGSPILPVLQFGSLRLVVTVQDTTR